MHGHDEQTGLHCRFPPRVSESVDVTEQAEDGVIRYVVRNSATARYFLLKQAEYRVFCQFDGTQTLREIAEGGQSRTGPRVSRKALTGFLTKLDDLGLLERGGHSLSASSSNQRGLYIKFHLFNPNNLLAWMNRRLGWAMTRPFITVSFSLMIVAALLMLANAGEVASYTSYTHAQYGLAAILATTLTITALHELAHGLACKHFGGDVREVGVLMIYYVLPAFYCNVSDIYRFGKRKERLWVIFAGIYWQLWISALGALIWIVATPYSMLADSCFLLFLGGTFNVIINCNPLIKLDGYYALSQAIGVQNLQARSSEYVGSLYSRLVSGRAQKSAVCDRPLLYSAYWICSVLYSVALIWFILDWAGGKLMDSLGPAGVVLTLLLALLLTERWWKPVARGIYRVVAQGRQQGGAKMSAQTASEKEVSDQSGQANEKRRGWLPDRRSAIKIAVVLFIATALVAPWEASTGSDCALLMPPGREEVMRANTDGLLSEIFVVPGDTVAVGAKIGRLTNPEIEDRLTQLNAEIERLSTNANRLEDELRVRSELLLSASYREVDRKRVAGELKEETIQITEWRKKSVSALPASLGVMQSEIELKQTELDFNKREVERYRKLLAQGLVGEQQLDRAVAAMKISEKELQAARARLEAALLEHRRQTNGAETTSRVAETEARAAQSGFEALIAELHANRGEIESLKQRRDLLEGEYKAMNLVARRSGVVLGDDLRRQLGRHYNRGEEICRIGELEDFLLRIEVSEREIAEVRTDSPVRFKLKTVPGRTFTGRVSKISAEAAPNQLGQNYYPVEVVVENSDGILRPGMTGYARISFGRKSIGLILANKLWQALRPELWLF